MSIGEQPGDLGRRPSVTAGRGPNALEFRNRDGAIAVLWQSPGSSRLHFPSALDC